MAKQQRKFFQSATGFVILNFIIAIIVALLLVIITVQMLKRYTLHGHEVTIPQVIGMSPEEAQMVLNGSEMQLVVIDSTYSSKAPLGTIVEQTPPAMSHAKPGRPVYVVMNARTKRLVPLPELHDVSYRQAQATLRSLGLNVADVVYEPSLYPDNVLDIRVEDQSIEVGTRLPEGTDVTLVVGRRQGNRMVAVPPVLGMSLPQARTALLNVGLTIGAYSYDEEPTPENMEDFIIYQQSPEEGAMIQEGSTVNISLSTSLERAVTSEQQQNEENFF